MPDEPANSLRCDRVELIRLALPLRRPFVTAAGSVGEREVVLVRIETGGVEGWGEASPVPGYSPETIDAVWDELTAAVPRLVTPAGLSPGLLRSAPAHSALEAAGDDLAARRDGLPLWRSLGGTRPAVMAGAALDLADDPADLAARADEAAAAGFRALKVKIAPGRDSVPLRAVLETVPGVRIGADGNGSYTPGDPALEALATMDLAYLEQPLPPAAAEALTGLARRSSTPIALDESARDAAATTRLLDAAPFAVTLKAQNLGGAGAYRQVLVGAAARGRPARAGGMLETGIGRAHALALATLPGHTLPSDLSAPTRYLAEDITDAAWAPQDGIIRPGDLPGIGVVVDPVTLTRLAVRRVAFG